MIWDGITVRGVVVLVTVWLLAAVVGSAAFFYRSVGEATPGALGAIRMWTCAVHLLMTFLEDFSSVALLPVETRNPRGILEYFYRLPIGFERFVTSETSLRALQLLTELLLVLGLVGWRTRGVIPLVAFCHFLLLGILIDHSFFWHQNLVPLYLLFALYSLRRRLVSRPPAEDLSRPRRAIGRPCLAGIRLVAICLLGSDCVALCGEWRGQVRGWRAFLVKPDQYEEYALLG
jgi:hypothetical protein